MIRVILLCCLLLCNCSYYYSIKNSVLFQQESQKKAWVYFYQGLEKKRLSLWQEAAECFHTAAALHYESPRVHMHLADCFVSLSLDQKAISSLQEAEKYASKEDYMLFFDMGKVYEKMNDYAKAKGMYEKSLVLFPKFKECSERMESLR